MRIKLKIENETDYSTRDLRRLFLAGMRAIGAEQPKTLVVRYRRRSPRRRDGEGRLVERSSFHISGRAFVGSRPLYIGERLIRPLVEGSRVWLFLPRHGQASNYVDQVARVIIHELWHSLGWHHREMPSDQRMDVSWAEGLPLGFRHAELPRIWPTAADDVRVEEK